MLLKKILAGKYFIQSICIQPLENSSQLFEITIFRKRAINLTDNLPMYVHNSYTRLNISKYNRIFKKYAKSTYSSIYSRNNWDVWYYFNSVNEMVYKFIGQSFYFLWFLYIILYYITK